jgi:hypothetical protein
MLKVILKKLVERRTFLDLKGTSKSVLITKVNESGVYIEKDGLTEEYNLYERRAAPEHVSFDLMFSEWERLIKVRTLALSNLNYNETFIIALFSLIPFVEVINNEVRIVEFR